MKFGWKPQVKGKILPIPLIFDMEDEFFNLDHLDPVTKFKMPDIYRGWRPDTSFKMYEKFLASTDQFTSSDFPFKLPSNLPKTL